MCVYNTWHESDGYGEVTFDLSPLADNGDLVDQRGRLQKVTQVHERPAVMLLHSIIHIFTFT